MSTYNGARHICRQMDSILKQDYDNIHVYVRDDGSKDNTVEILEKYEKTDKRVTIVRDNLGNLGVPYSFYRLMTVCPAGDYYAFADQDDEWKKEKIRYAAETLICEEEKNVSGTKKPLLYISSYEYCTEDGKYIRDFPKQNPDVKFCHVLYYSIGSGFTMVFNDEERKISIPAHLNCMELHDRRLQRTAVAFGKVIIDNRSTAKHIRYQDSVTADDSSNEKLFVSWLKNEFFGNKACEEKKFLRDFMQQYGKKLSRHDYRTLRLFATNKKNPIIYLSKVFYPHRLRTRFLGEVVLRFMFLTGKL